MVNKQLSISGHHDDIRIWFTSRTFFCAFLSYFRCHKEPSFRRVEIFFESQRRRTSTLEQAATAKEHIKNLLGREMKSDKFICFSSVHNGFGGGEWEREDLMSNFLQHNSSA